MKDFFENFFKNLLKLIEDIPNILRFLLYGVAVIALVWVVKIVFFPKIDTQLKLLTNLMLATPSDSLITSSGRSGNFIYITKNVGNGDGLIYWSDYSMLQEKVIQEQRKSPKPYTAINQHGSLCVFETDFSFGYKDRAKGLAYFQNKKGAPLLYPALFSSNPIYTDELTLKSQNVANAYCHSYFNGTGDAVVTRPDLKTPCKKVDGNCGKSRISAWLNRDGVLRTHLEQGIKSAAAAALGELKRCERIRLIKSYAADKSTLPKFCQSYIGTDGNFISHGTIYAQYIKAKVHLNSLVDDDTGEIDICYDAITGSVCSKKTEVASGNIFQSNTDSSTSGFDLVSKAFAGDETLNADPMPETFPESISNTSYLLTFSTIATYSAKKKRFIFWDDDEFAFRRDVSKVYYGTTIPNFVSTSTLGPISNVILPSPARQAIDQWTVDYGVVYDGKLNVLNEPKYTDNMHLTTLLNEKIKDSLDDALKFYDREAIERSREILNDRYSSDNSLISFEATNGKTSTLFDNVWSRLQPRLQ